MLEFLVYQVVLIKLAVYSASPSDKDGKMIDIPVSGGVSSLFDENK